MESSRFDDLSVMRHVLENMDRDAQNDIIKEMEKTSPDQAQLLKHQVLHAEKILSFEEHLLVWLLRMISLEIWARVLVHRSPVFLGKVQACLPAHMRENLTLIAKSVEQDPHDIAIRKVADVHLVQQVRALEKKGLIEMDSTGAFRIRLDQAG
jgi:flagellar motor switch protein FliG